MPTKRPSHSPSSSGPKSLPTPSDPPGREEIQVSLFGPGYGEAILIHVGSERWIIIDSCMRPGSDEPVPLSYLRSIGADPATSVDLIIASHWHDDHTRGMSRIVESCPKAIFCCPIAFGHEKLIILGARYRARKLEHRSGLKDLIQVQNSLFDSKRKPQYAHSAGLIKRWPKGISGLPFEVSLSSMSPTDAALDKCIKQFASLIGEVSPERALPTPKENLTAIVLRLDFGDQSILLGSDMESSASYGWEVLLADSRNTSRKSFVFKIAHHGASSGHHDQIWKVLLEPKPFAFVSPFVKGRQRLPEPDDLRRIRKLTDKAFITANPQTLPPPRKRSPAIERTLKEKGIPIYPSLLMPGHIRFRVAPGRPGSQKEELFDGAYSL